jgi:hypothetical protein
VEHIALWVLDILNRATELDITDFDSLWNSLIHSYQTLETRSFATLSALLEMKNQCECKPKHIAQFQTLDTSLPDGTELHSLSNESFSGLVQCWLEERKGKKELITLYEELAKTYPKCNWTLKSSLLTAIVDNNHIFSDMEDIQREFFNYIFSDSLHNDGTGEWAVWLYCVMGYCNFFLSNYPPKEIIYDYLPSIVDIIVTDGLPEEERLRGWW